MSKKHSGAKKSKASKSPHDPNFADKKIIQNKNMQDKNAQGKNAQSSDEAKNDSGKVLDRSNHLTEKSISAESLHNREVKQQTAAKKSTQIPEEFQKHPDHSDEKAKNSSKDANSGDEIIVNIVNKNDKAGQKESDRADQKEDDKANQKKNSKTGQKSDNENRKSVDKSVNKSASKKVAASPKVVNTKIVDAKTKKPLNAFDDATKSLKNGLKKAPEKESGKELEKESAKQSRTTRIIPKEKTTVNQSQAAGITPKKKERFDWRKTWHKHPMPAILKIPCLVLILAGAAILFTWFIFWRTNFYDVDAVAEFIGEKPLLFSYSCMIVFFLMAVVAAITWHAFFTIGLSFVVASVVSFISMQKFQLREEPFLPSDLVFTGQVGNLMGMIDAEAIWRLIGGVVLVMVGSILLEVYVCKVFGKRVEGRPWWERHALISRATYTMISLAGLAMTLTPILQHENPKWLEGFKTVAWDQPQTFGFNGFILDFISNINKTSAEKPESYSKETMMKIAEKYWAIKEADDANRKPFNEVADQVFIVLDESFYDPALIKDYYNYGNKDVLPVLHEIFKNYPSGYMYSPGYGGGTANIEFEVQTGYSNYWANSYPYIDVVSKNETFLSAANWAKKYDFEAQAIHAYYSETYGRDKAYPALGYDSFIDINAMTIHRSEPGTVWPNDSAIFEEAIELANENDSSLINVVTMQNHGGYFTQDYPYTDFEVTNGSRKEEATRYLRLLHATDQYLGDWIEELEDSKKRSVILWFGDHAAGIFPEVADSKDKSESDLVRLTPYFIWANFDLESDDKKTIETVAKKNKELGFDFSEIEGVDLPVTTPNCLLNQMYNVLNVEKPAMYYLLDKVCEEVPIITGAYYKGSSLPDSKTLREYELVNYDAMNGKRYWDGE